MEELSPAFANDQLRFLTFTQLFGLCVVIAKRTWFTERVAASHDGSVLSVQDETQSNGQGSQAVRLSAVRTSTAANALVWGETTMKMLAQDDKTPTNATGLPIRSNRRLAAAKLSLPIIALLFLSTALTQQALGQSVGSRSLQRITQTATAATGWTESIWSCGKDHIYWRTVTYNVTGTITNNTVTYTNLWNRIWDRGGVITATVTTPLAARTITVTEYRHLGFFAGPPPNGLPGPNRYSVTDPPPVDDTGYYFLQASSQLRLPSEPLGTNATSYLAALGGGYQQTASSFTSFLADLSAVNDPYGLKSTFVSDVTNLQGDFSHLGLALQSGIPTSGSPFSALANDLNTFTHDVTMLPGRPNYVFASPYLTAAANSLDDAATQVNMGICDNAGNPNCNGSQSLADMGAVPYDFLQFAKAEAAQEPSSLVLMGSSLLGIGGLLRRRYHTPKVKRGSGSLAE